jgi:hypothetical protein
MEFFGDHVADLAVGDTARHPYGFIDFEDARASSSFRKVSKEGTGVKKAPGSRHRGQTYKNKSPILFILPRFAARIVAPTDHHLESSQ